MKSSNLIKFVKSKDSKMQLWDIVIPPYQSSSGSDVPPSTPPGPLSVKRTRLREWRKNQEKEAEQKTVKVSEEEETNVQTPGVLSSKSSSIVSSSCNSKVLTTEATGPSPSSGIPHSATPLPPLPLLKRQQNKHSPSFALLRHDHSHHPRDQEPDDHDPQEGEQTDKEAVNEESDQTPVLLTDTANEGSVNETSRLRTERTVARTVLEEAVRTIEGESERNEGEGGGEEERKSPEAARASPVTPGPGADGGSGGGGCRQEEEHVSTPGVSTPPLLLPTPSTDQLSSFATSSKEEPSADMGNRCGLPQTHQQQQQQHLHIVSKHFHRASTGHPDLTFAQSSIPGTNNNRHSQSLSGNGSPVSLSGHSDVLSGHGTDCSARVSEVPSAPGHETSPITISDDDKPCPKVSEVRSEDGNNPSGFLLTRTGSPACTVSSQVFKLKRFLTTLHQFAIMISPSVGNQVRDLIHALVVSLSIFSSDARERKES